MSLNLLAVAGAGVALLVFSSRSRRIDDSIHIHSIQPYAPAQSARMAFESAACSVPVRGDASFAGEVDAALALIAEHAPEFMQFIDGHLHSIEYGGERTDRWAELNVPGTCTIFNGAINGSTISLAKTIAHEAYHAYQYANGLPFDEGPAEDYERQLGARLRG